MSVKKIRARIAELQEAKKQITKHVDEQIRIEAQELELAIPRQMLTCSHCNKRTAISEIRVVTEYWWDENVGCPAGTGHYEERGTHFLCPKCGLPDKNNKRFAELWQQCSQAFKEHTEHKP